VHRRPRYESRHGRGTFFGEARCRCERTGSDGSTALHWAVRIGDTDTAAVLIRAGARVTVSNRYGATPIYLACFNGNTAMIRLLLDSGADVNSADSTGEAAR
jgi:uncharacterized protein